MLPLRLPALFLIGAALLVSAAAFHALRRPAPPPQTVAELAEAIHHFAPTLHIVRVQRVSAECGIYVCSSPRSLEELQLTPRAPERAGSWRGVVFCEHTGADCEDWGDNGLQIGPLQLFGDPSLLRRIRSKIGQGGGRD